MEYEEFFAPWRLVAAFADGSRLLFDGLTEEQAREAMEAAQEEAFLRKMQSFSLLGGWSLPLLMAPGSCSTD